jgi:hypothetical protein
MANNANFGKGMMEYEDHKLPSFANDPATDTVTAREFIGLVDQQIINYDVEQPQIYARVLRALAGNARLWLESQEDNVANWTKTWTALKPIFTEEFIKRDDSAWVNALALKLKYGDNFWEHCKKIDNLFRIFYDIQGTAALPFVMGGLADTAPNRAAVKNHGNSCFTAIKMTVFKASMPDEIISHLNDKRPANMEDMMRIARIFFEAKSAKNKAKIAAVEDTPETDSANEDVDPEVLAVMFKKFARNQFGKKNNSNKFNNGRKFNNQSSGQTSSGYRGNQQKKSEHPLRCMFCNVTGHHMHQCRTRIEQGKPCYSPAGRPYYPERSSKDSKKVNDINQDDEATASSVFQ